MKTKVISLVTLGFLVPLASQATPTLYPNSPGDLARIRNTTSSNIIGDTDSASIVYVLPPNVGSAKGMGMHSLSGSVMLCEQMPILAKQSTRYLDAIEAMETRHAGSLDSINALEQKITDAKIGLSKYVASANLKQLDDLNDQIAETQASLDEKRAGLDTCTGDACGVLKEEISVIVKAKAAYVKARSDFQVKNLKAARIYNQKKAVVDALTEQKDANEANFVKISDDLYKAKEKVESQFFAFNEVYGARAYFSFETPWDENVSALRAANPNVNFAKLNTSNSVIYPQLEVFPKVKANPIIGMDIVGGGNDENSKGIHFSSFPGVVQTNVVMNLFGVCPIARPDLFIDSAVRVDPNDMKYSVVASYEFPSSMRLKMTAKYKLRSLYTKVMNSWKKGGFFSSSSGTDVKEHEEYKDSFSVNWTEQDPENRLSDADRRKMETDAKIDLLDRVAKAGIGVKSSSLGALPATDPRGAAVLAESVMKACPTNIWCVAGSGVLSALDSIFGSSNSSGSLKKISNAEAEETWELNKVVMKPWVTSYVYKK